MMLRTCVVRVLGVALCLSLLGCGDEDSPTQVTNGPPTACFTVSPASGTTETVFVFDGSCSHDPQDSTAALSVRWDWEDDGAWDTEWSATKTVTHRFETAGVMSVRMEVRDSGDLTHAMADSVAVGVPNQPPTACFTLDPTQGTVETAFAFDASCSTDDEDAIDSLQVRWDWEDDGSGTPGGHSRRQQVIRTRPSD